MSANGVTTILPLFLRDAAASAADVNRAIESVLLQDCNVPLELLIVDDGSVPQVASIQELQVVLRDPRVRLLRLVQNQGLVYALNAGLTQARYNLVARIDGDDFWRPGKLKVQLEVLASDPDITLVATSMRLVHPHNPSYDRDEIRDCTWEGVLSLFARYCPFPHGSILARKDVFHLLGGYPHTPLFTHCEDYALWGSWARFFKVCVLSEVLFEYTVSQDQISARFAEEQKRASDAVLKTFLDLGDHGRIPASIARIAELLDLPLLKASKLLCAAWMFYDEILVDQELYEAARFVFPDRPVHLYQDVRDLPADRFFYLHYGTFDRQRSAHARCVHTPDTLEPLLSAVE
jgi:glycosyltransferase involved in cell wall biosynthesis